MITKVVGGVTIDQPTMVPKKIFSELGKSAVETQLSKESSLESEIKDSNHTEMDLEPEGETP